MAEIKSLASSINIGTKQCNILQKYLIKDKGFIFSKKSNDHENIRNFSITKQAGYTNL